MKLVLDAGDPHELHVLLEVLLDGRIAPLITVLHGILGILVGGGELLVLFLSHKLLRNDERSKPFPADGLALILEEPSLDFRYLGFHDRVGALQVEEVIGALKLEHDAHALSLGREGKLVKYLVLLIEVRGSRDEDFLVGAFYKLHTNALGEFHKRDFVGAACLEGAFAIVVKHGRHIMAEDERGHEVTDKVALSVLADGVLGEALLLEDLFELADGLLSEHRTLEREPLHHHGVLGKSASFIAQDVGNAAELLRKVGTPSNSPRDLLVVIDPEGKIQLSEVEVDS